MDIQEAVLPDPAQTQPSSVADKIRQMNEEAQSARESGEKNFDLTKKPAPAAPAAQTPPPAQTGQQPKPPVPAQPAKPKAGETLTKDKNTPPQPKLVEKTEPANPPAAAAPGAPPVEAPQAPAAPANTELVFSERLSSLTDGHLKTEDDFVGMVQHYNQLLAQAEEGFKPKFKDERAALAYQILAGNAGSEPEAAMRTLRALNFKPEGKSPKDVLFQAYLMDPKNQDLSETQAKDLFEADYNETYAGLNPDNENENTKKLAQRSQDLAVKEALANITKVQSDFKTIEEKPQQMAVEVENSIKKAVENFGGIRVAFTDNPTENDYMNVAINDPRELAAIQEMALNPVGEWNQFMDQFQTEKGFDYPNYVRAYYERTHAVELRQQAYEHGVEAGKLSEINRLRNASNPKEIHQSGAPGGAEKPLTFMQTWEKAAQAAGR